MYEATTAAFLGLDKPDANAFSIPSNICSISEPLNPLLMRSINDNAMLNRSSGKLTSFGNR
jgi:hypothetical protein